MSQVLVVGKAPEVVDRLAKRGHQIILWPESLKPKKSLVSDALSFESPYSASSVEIKKLWKEQLGGVKPDYVIACSEKSVLPAARARSAFRIAKNSYKVVERFRNKKVMKRYLKKFSTPMTPYIFCHKQTDLRRLIKKLGLPLVLKEAQTSGSRGLLISSDYNELKKFSLAGKIAEKFISYPEYSVESFVHEGEIIFTNITQYYRKASINIVPSSGDEGRNHFLLAMNHRVLKNLGVKQGMTHLEVYDSGDDLLFGEVALRPPGGYIMELLSCAYDMDAWDAYVALELGELVKFPTVAKLTCASFIYHPGEGIVQDVVGFEEVKNHTNCFFAKCKLHPGKVVKRRDGLGQNGGHFLIKHPDAKSLLSTISEIDKKFKIEMRKPA